MNTKPVPSWYRYCMSRRSTLAVSTLVSELNVRSTTLPDSTCFNLVRTTVLPLPGLWCWNQTTDHSWPSRSRTIPFFRSFVDATRCHLSPFLPPCWAAAKSRPPDEPARRRCGHRRLTFVPVERTYEVEGRQGAVPVVGQGSGRAILVVHGGTGDLTAWAGVAERLASDFRVLRY